MQSGEGTWNSPGSPAANTRVWDNLVVSTARIGCIAGTSESTQIAWDADAIDSSAQGTCLLNTAIIDTTEKNQGTASMKTSYTGGQGDRGCKDFGQRNLDISWNSGKWLCHNWDMKIDSAFVWDEGNQKKMKASRVVGNNETGLGGKWTLYLKQGKVDVSECPECDNCPSGGDCTNLFYDFDPPTNPAVANWQSYTFGLKLATGPATDDGEAKLWVNGTLEDSETNQTYCTTCTGSVRDAWGVFGMRTHPQSPTGFIHWDDFLMTTSDSECIPRI